MYPSRLIAFFGLATFTFAAVLMAATFVSASPERAPSVPAGQFCGDNLAGERCEVDPPRFCSNCIFTATPTLTPTPTPTPTSTPMPTATAVPSATAVSTATDVPPPTDTAIPPGLAGDVNCDGVVDSKDAALILQFESGRLASLPCGGNGDVNGDGVIDSLDAQLVLVIEATSPA